MDLITRANFMGAAGVSTGETLDSTTIGDSANGGFFAGYISHTANGTATHGLIVGPRSIGYGAGYGDNGKRLASTTGACGGTSPYDGASNTDLMVANLSGDHLTYISGLSHGGFDDWYIPAQYELEIAYYNLTPVASTTTAYGANPYSVPTRTSNYSTGNPGQTSLTDWQSGGTEAFSTSSYDQFYWTSTENSSNTTQNYLIRFASGLQGWLAKNYLLSDGFSMRPFRRVAL